MSPLYALVDCNNFYASCEKLFRPDLKDTPIVVLSNNDGCVVALSKEAKALGIKMAVEVFKIQNVLNHHGVLSFSFNYSLYADISSRVKRTLEAMAPRVEVYSIDEAFLELTGNESTQSLNDYGQRIRHTIAKWIGIHVCVGIAPTKTLAKLANHAAKQYPETLGVVDLTRKERQQNLLKIMPVSEVWGVGRKLSKRLNEIGIIIALDLANSPIKMIRKHFSVVLERTVRELNGHSCIAFEEVPPTKKQIVSSRSFGKHITTYQQLSEAISEYAVRAGEKLRKEKQKAKVVSIFIRTSPFKLDEPQYSNGVSGQLIVPSDDTRDFIELSQVLLKRIWKDDYRYAKAGIMLSDFYDSDNYQKSLFTDQARHSNGKELMSVIDTINQSDIGHVFFGMQGIKSSWKMKREHLSPAYTTRWSELPLVK